MRNARPAVVFAACWCVAAATIARCAGTREASVEELSPRVRAQLELTRSRQYEAALSSNTAFLATSAGAQRGEERCAMLLTAAFSEAMLKRTADGEQHFSTFSRECADSPPYGWRAEVQRVRRLLNGESAQVVYASAGGQ